MTNGLTRGRHILVLTLASLSVFGCARSRPGERLVADTSRIAPECGRRAAPSVLLEANELTPVTVRPGVTAAHRFTYSLCLPATRQEIRGRLTTRILSGTQILYRDTVPDYRLRSGRWQVNTGIAVPAEAPDGAYQVQIDFNGEVNFEGTTPMSVRRR